MGRPSEAAGLTGAAARAARRHARAIERRGLSLLGGLAGLAAVAPLVWAMHGTGGLPAVVESERLTAGAEVQSPGVCVMTGIVRNPNTMAVTVQLAWRAADATGATVGVAAARLPQVAPGERRPFVSSPFVSLATRRALPSCAGMPHVERLETAAEPSP